VVCEWQELITFWRKYGSRYVRFTAALAEVWALRVLLDFITINIIFFTLGTYSRGRFKN